MNDIVVTIRNGLKYKGFQREVIKCITAQAAHETANFTSRVFRNNNNMFGMRFPVKRPTMAVKNLNGYSYYNSIEDSISDIVLYLDYVNFSKSYIEYLAESPLREYVEFLKSKKYFEDTIENYYKGCLHFYNLYYA